MVDVLVMKDFEPRPLQENVFKKMAETPGKTLLRIPSRCTHYGIDMGERRSDRTVVARAKMNGKGITSVVFDEYTSIPVWYRNPIKQWLFNRAMKKVIKQMRRDKKEGKIWTSFDL